jgi:3-hydroxybutyryl-CoA dehydrogenase
VLWARSDASAERARKSVAKLCDKLGDAAAADRVTVANDQAALHGETFIVEAVVEDPDHKSALLAELGAAADPEAILATTTSSLSIEDLARASGRPERFLGLHVFIPLGKTAVEVPDTPGFVVNRLLFPYLFDAVGFMVEHDMAPADVDKCMTLGAGVPMGPIALLDFVGLDVSMAIGDTIGVEVPGRVRELVAEGALGRKAGRGFYDYS